MVPTAVHGEQITTAFNESPPITKPLSCPEDFVIITRVFSIYPDTKQHPPAPASRIIRTSTRNMLVTNRRCQSAHVPYWPPRKHRRMEQRPSSESSSTRLVGSTSSLLSLFLRSQNSLRETDNDGWLTHTTPSFAMLQTPPRPPRFPAWFGHAVCVCVHVLSDEEDLALHKTAGNCSA